MYALHSVPPHSARVRPRQALVAIVYANEAYPQSTFERIVENCRGRGLRLAGVLQHPVCSGTAGHCDVALEELTTGLRTDLFEDRGPGASGCRLDVAALAEVNAQVARSLDNDPELLILNKFGKVEAEGRGLLDLVATAVDRSIPVVIGVPIRNLEAWRNFAGGMSVEFSSDPFEILDWLNRTFPVAMAQSAVPAPC
jgi:nucleoside-triphosphatase THEP1